MADQYDAMDMNAWYKLWLDQSEKFRNITEKFWRDILAQDKFLDPEKYRTEINDWLKQLQAQWQMMQFEKAQATYFKVLQDMYQEVSQSIFANWKTRFNENKPIHNVNEIYDLWLKTWQEVYEKNLHSQSNLDTYGDFMKASLKFWEEQLKK